MDHQRESLSKTIAKYASSRIYQQGLGALTAFLRPKLLSPEQYGLWVLLKTILTNVAYAHLGSQISMRVMVPYHKARKEEETVSAMKDTVFSSNLAINVLVSLGILGVCLWPGASTQVRVGFLALAVLVMLQFYYEYDIAVLKAHEKFALIGASNYLQTTVAFVLTPPLLYFYGLYGLFASLVASSAVTVLYLRLKFNPHTRFRFQYSVFRNLVIRGFPIMMADLLVVLVTTSDRYIVSGFLGSKELGYYGIATMVLGFLKNVPGTAREVMEPRLMKQAENSHSVENVNEYLLQPLINTAFLLPFAIGPLYLLIPFVITHALPLYIPAIVPTQILSCGVYFFAMCFPPRTMIVAINRQVEAILTLPVVWAANIAFGILLVKSGYGINGVSVSTTLAFLMLLVCFMAVITRHIKSKGPYWTSHLIGSMLPFPAMCVLIIVPERLFGRVMGPGLLPALASVAVFWVGMYLFHRFVGRRFHLVTQISLRQALRLKRGEGVK